MRRRQGSPPSRLPADSRRVPVTWAYLVALAATTMTLVGLRARLAEVVISNASTNLSNMASQPVRVLVVSAFWLESPWLIWPTALLLVLLMAPAERLVGGARTVLVFVVGHVGATMTTVSAIAAGVDRGWLPPSLVHAVDIGPSYGLAALAGLLLTRVPGRGRRRAAVATALVALTVTATVGSDFTDAGHLIAMLLGLATARFVRPRPEAEGPFGGGPSSRAGFD